MLYIYLKNYPLKFCTLPHVSFSELYNCIENFILNNEWYIGFIQYYNYILAFGIKEVVTVTPSLQYDRKSRKVLSSLSAVVLQSGLTITLIMTAQTVFLDFRIPPDRDISQSLQIIQAAIDQHLETVNADFPCLKLESKISGESVLILSKG